MNKKNGWQKKTIALLPRYYLKYGKTKKTVEEENKTRFKNNLRRLQNEIWRFSKTEQTDSNNGLQR